MADAGDPGFGELREGLLSFHQAFIKAHVENRPEFFIENKAEGYVNISRGELLRPTDTETLEAMTDYLGNTTFTEYRILDEPKLGFSRDGSVAWSIFQLKVAGTRRLPDGSERTFDDTWGCLFLFERRGDQWVRLAEASNLKPE